MLKNVLPVSTSTKRSFLAWVIYGLCLEVYGENEGKSNKERLQEEIAAHKSLLEAEHVVKLYDVKEEKDGYYLFMEMCDKDLGKLIKEKGNSILMKEDFQNAKLWICLDSW